MIADTPAKILFTNQAIASPWALNCKGNTSEGITKASVDRPNEKEPTYIDKAINVSMPSSTYPKQYPKNNTVTIYKKVDRINIGFLPNLSISIIGITNKLVFISPIIILYYKTLSPVIPALVIILGE